MIRGKWFRQGKISKEGANVSTTMGIRGTPQGAYLIKGQELVLQEELYLGSYYFALRRHLLI